MNVVSLEKALATINDFWSPVIIGELNNQVVKAVKLKGEFVMHHHDHEDEMFMVLKGKLQIAFAEETKVVGEGEFLIIPRGIPHKPVAEEEVHVLLFEPVSTVNTGNVVNERTIENPPRIG